jgi:hypothetical protein
MARQSRSSCEKSGLAAAWRAVGGSEGLALGVGVGSSRLGGTVPVIRPSGNTLAATFRPERYQGMASINIGAHFHERVKILLKIIKQNVDVKTKCLPFSSIAL